MVTYKQLKIGYVLQPNDELILHGLDYEVYNYTSDGYYLYNRKGTNSHIFDILRMDAKERKDFVKRFNPVRFGDAKGAFPEFSSLKALTDIVKALYEVPEYKEGDWVTILPRKESTDYHPVWYADDMTRYAEKTCRIKRCNLRSETQSCGGVDNGDPHSYDLNEVGYHWTSQMIRKATEEEIRKVKVEVKDSDSPTPPENTSTSPEDTVQRLKAIMDETVKSIQPHLGDFIVGKGIPMYTSLYKDVSEDTEIRLPNNEEETPHIKL